MEKEKILIRKPVFVTMLLLYAFIILVGLVSPEMFASAEGAIVNFAASGFGWLYDLTALVLLAFCVWIMCSKKIGSIRLGGENAKPVMSKWSWFVISLCGGIATGIVFWGIAEPVTHFMSPIPGFGYEAESAQGALYALSTCYMHWGPMLYAFYAVAGVGIGVAVYNLKLPYRVCSCLYPILGRKAMGAIGTVVDILCLFGLAGGVSASLGVSAMQLGAGLGLLTNITPSNVVWTVILLTIVISFIISSYTGIGRGVRFLSDKNAKIYMGMLVFVLLFGPTRYILNMSAEALGFHMNNLMRQATYLDVFEGGMWPTWWTLNYWSFMIAYTPLIGMFLAKIARGRTLKEFITYNFVIPGAFGVLWFGIFGSAAIYFQSNSGGIWESMQSLGTESAVFAFFEHFPLSKVLSAIFMITAFLSVVTLSDSMTTTISSLSINAKNAATVEPPAKVKIFWGLVMSALALVNIVTASNVGKVSGIDATKQLAIVAAFPLLFVIVAMIFSTTKMLLQYQKYDTIDHPEESVVEPELQVEHEEEA